MLERSLDRLLNKKKRAQNSKKYIVISHYMITLILCDQAQFKLNRIFSHFFCPVLRIVLLVHFSEIKLNETIVFK